MSQMIKQCIVRNKRNSRSVGQTMDEVGDSRVSSIARSCELADVSDAACAIKHILF